MNPSTTAEGSSAEYVTVTVEAQLFGLPIARVQDVFIPDRLTRVPLAPDEVAGILNLRGRIVTAIEMRSRLGLPPRPAGQPVMALGVDRVANPTDCWWMASARCCGWPTRPASPSRSISIRGWRASPRRWCGSTDRFWSCSTSIACST